MRSVDELPLATEVFETGKTRRNLYLVVLGAFAFVVGCRMLPRSWDTMRSVVGVFIGLAPGLVLVAGGIAAVGALQSYRISVVALFPEGLLFRNWRSRTIFVLWDEIVEVYIDRWGLGVTDVLSQTARSVYILVKTEGSAARRVRLSTEDSDEKAVRLASELATWASLRHRGIIRPCCEVWDRPTGSGEQ